MPERPRPNLNRVREALEDRDEAVERELEDRDETAEPESAPTEDDGDT